MRALLLLPAALALLACGRQEPVPGPEPRVEVRAPAGSVVSGTAFPVTIVRTWKVGDEPSVASERDLAPLAAHLLSSTRRDDGRLVEETLSYRAHAFALKDVVVRPVPFAVRAPDGTVRRAAGPAPLRVGVRTEVDPAAPGVPELPEPAPPEPRSPWPWVAGAFAIAAAALLVVLRRRRRAARKARPSPAAGDSPDPRAIDALARLSDADPAVAVPAASETLRAWLEARFALPVLERTTEETLALPALERALEPAARAALKDVLSAGDGVKFAEHVPAAAERDAVLSAAALVIRAGAERGA